MASDFPWEERIEVAFATLPMAASPTWTDISIYGSAVNPVGRAYGRPDEFSDVQPGTLSVLLNNSDGRFTRGRAASPYYPNVKNGRRIRWSMIYASNTYVRFDGHVNEWPTTWEPGTGGGLSWVQITATDRMKRFGQVGELRSMVEEEVLRDAVAADSTHGSCYYPLSEPSESTSAGSVTKQPQGAAIIRQVGSGGMVEFGSGTGPGTDGLSATLFTPASTSAGKLLDATLRTGVGGPSGITLEGFFRTGTVSNIAIVGMLTTPAGATAELRIDASGHLSGAAWTAVDGGYYFNLASLNRVDDNRTHHGALTMSISGSTVTARLYLDGAQVDTATFTATGLSTYTRLSIGGDPKAGRMFSGTLSHLAAHSAALSAARVAAHATAGLSGFAGERTDQRVGRVADWISIPTGDRAFDIGNGTVGAQSTSGQQPVEVMRQAAAAESGVLFIGRTGLLTFHNRQRRYNLTPAFTLDAALGQIAPDLAFAGDDFGVTNDMTVSRPDGSSARTVDQSSIDEYGLYRDSQEIPAGSADELSSAASWRVNTYGTPRTRVPQVTVNLHDPRVASLIPQLLAADISTKLRLVNLPSQAPSSTVDLFVEGYAESFDGPSWTITFNCSPGDVYNVWQLGLAGFSELGLTTRLAQAGATTPEGTINTIYSGAWASGLPGSFTALNTFETDAAKACSIVHFFNHWGDTGGAQDFPTAAATTIRSRGSIPMITWEPWVAAGGVTQPTYSLANIIAGNFDTYITTWATAAAAWGHPFFLRFAHEMNGDWYPWCEGVNGNTTGQYAQAWQHVYNLVHPIAPLASFVWCPMRVPGGVIPIQGLYPGSAYVDWTGFDLYNFISGSFGTFAFKLGSTYTDLLALAPDKPIMVAEVGVVEDPGGKAAWITATLAGLPSTYPQIKAWVYFNAVGTKDWRIETSAGATTAYAAGIADIRYLSNSFGTLADAPIPTLLSATTPAGLWTDTWTDIWS